MSRSVVARQAKVERKVLDQVRDTLTDRGLITIVAQKQAKSGPPAEVWRIVDGPICDA